MDLFQRWRYGFHRLLRIELCHFSGGFISFLMLLCLDGETEAVQLPSPNGFFYLISPVRSCTERGSQEPRDPEDDGRLGKKKNLPSLYKIKEST